MHGLVKTVNCVPQVIKEQVVYQLLNIPKTLYNDNTKNNVIQSLAELEMLLYYTYS